MVAKMVYVRDQRTIDLAASILAELDRPASAKEIVDHARRDPRFSQIANGKTPHKTINARLSIDIIKNGEKSRFFRFAPSSFGLRHLAKTGVYEGRYQVEYLAHNRRKAVAKENIAVINVSDLNFLNQDGIYDGDYFPLSILKILPIRYVERKSAEPREDIKQLVSYAYIRHRDQVVAFERGKYTSDGGEFVGRHSIGFGGHVNSTDISLFDETGVGLYENIYRELHEELYMFRNRIEGIVSDVIFRGYLVDSTTTNGRRHLGLAVEIKLKSKIDLHSSGLGIKNIRWISAKATPNCFHKFEIWSQYLYRFLQGK